jgi:uncharacterized peroxidase-related enzyme
MARINPIHPASTDEKTHSTLKLLEKKFGSLPNIFTTFAVSPAALQAYLAFNENMASGRLSTRQRELIAIAVATANDCGYCLAAHNAIGKGVGLDDTDVALAQTGKAHSEDDGAILDFALQVVHSRGNVSDDQLRSIRAAVGSEETILEIVANVVLNIFTNYVNRVADTDVDFPAITFEPAA